MRTLNLGILAHVDAGKTSLTERLLFDTGAIAKLGSVDGGNTQTDSLAIERQRGITIASAVVSFRINDLDVNLIDTPGHPDFIAEVERILRLLDAAIVVVSAVEGVQAQTRVLVRALQRLGIPFLVFVNKIDRMGARYLDVVADIAKQLAVRPIAMMEARDIGSRVATAKSIDVSHDPGFSALCEMLTVNDDCLLRDFVAASERLTPARLTKALADQVANGLIHPVYCGVAMTGTGVSELLSAIETLLPSRTPSPDGPVKGSIFKIERGWGGEKLAYLNLTSGTVAARGHLQLPTGNAKVTSIQVFGEGNLHRHEYARAGQIAKIGGLTDARIGDEVGADGRSYLEGQFAPPTLETQVSPQRPSESRALWVALQHLSEQDPLINLHTNEDASEMYLSLYGEVQKEVIQSTLLADYGVDAVFQESTVILVERPIGTGRGLEVIFKEANPFLATIGLRVEPRPEGTGNSFAMEVDVGQMPAGFYRAIEETVSETLKAGIHGWQVIDCHVALTSVRHHSPSSTAADFRGLTPLVLAAALTSAQTIICEPIERFRLEVPVTALPNVQVALAKSGASTEEALIEGGIAQLRGMVTSAQVQALRRVLPGLSGGAGILENAFDHHSPIAVRPRARARTGANPFDRINYLRAIH